MEIIKKELCYIPVKKLEKGMFILNVGIVKSIQEYLNAVSVSIVSGDILNSTDKVDYSIYKWIYVESSKGSPTKNFRYVKQSNK